MSQIRRQHFKEAIMAYLEKVDGTSWNYDYTIEGFDRKIKHSAAVLIFESLDNYLSKAFSIADMISVINEEDIISEESAAAAIANILQRKRLIIEHKEEQNTSGNSAESTYSSTINQA